MKKLFVLLLILTPLVATAQHKVKPGKSKPATHRVYSLICDTCTVKTQMIPVVSTSAVPNPQDGYLINSLPTANYKVYFNATSPGYWITYSPINHIDTVHLNLSRMHVLNDSTFTIK